MNASLQPNDRQIRVFISSTFRDMQEERDILIKRIFPQLRKLCEERAVTWTEVDLRWGITTEQAAEGKVLPLCLEEIHRCRPYFIGLLGERYGWVPEPDSIPAELLDSQPWLKQHLDHSVTELEILHGVFSEEAMHGHAYFYFRDPKYFESVPTEKRQDFTIENAEAEVKLAKLKQKIRGARHEQVCELRENYTTPEQLGEWILEDFTKLIDRLYPKDKTPDTLDQEAARHDAYARSRRLAFVGREDLLCRLNEHAAVSGKPLVLTGESGCGKSALLAEWVARWRKNHPDDLIIQHYIGSTPDSADWQVLVRRILSELKRAFSITDEIPVQLDALRSALNDWTAKVASSRRIVLVLDALNQLAEDGAARQLGWLPVAFPTNFRLLVSSLSGESLDALRKRGWPELNVPLFVRADIAPAAIAYFKVFSKTPPPVIVAKLESTPAACNALYLRAVLDELRQFGIYQELPAKAVDYLAACDPKELYERILERWERDFGEDLVRQTMSLIWAARRGLSEAELADMLGEHGQPLPRAMWTPLYLAAEASLLQRSGLLNFAHSYVREAVRARYVSTFDMQKRMHSLLAEYFQAQKKLCARKLDETPWQLARARLWQELFRLFDNGKFLLAAMTHDSFDFYSHWALIEVNSGLRVIQAYKSGPVPGETAAQLMEHFGHHPEAYVFRYGVLQQAWVRTDVYSEDFATASLRLANSLYAQGKLRESLELFSLAEKSFRELGLLNGVQACLGNKANIFADLGDIDSADRLLREQESICRDHGITDALEGNLCAQGLLCLDKGNIDDAMRLLKEAERLSRAAGSFDALQRNVGNLAVALKAKGDLNESLKLFEEKERLCQQLGKMNGVVQSLWNEAEVTDALGNRSRAEDLFRKAERVCQERADNMLLCDTYAHWALLLNARGDLKGALARHTDEEHLARQLGDKRRLQVSLGNQGIALGMLGDALNARRLLKEQEVLCGEIGDKRGIVSALINQSFVASGSVEAIALANQALEVARSNGLHELAERISVRIKANEMK